MSINVELFDTDIYKLIILVETAAEENEKKSKEAFETKPAPQNLHTSNYYRWQADYYRLLKERLEATIPGSN